MKSHNKGLFFAIFMVLGQSTMSITAFPEESELERADLADSIKLAFPEPKDKVFENSTSTSQPPTEGSTVSTLEITSAIPKKDTNGTTNTSNITTTTEESKKVMEDKPIIQTIQVVQLPVNENIFTGLAQNVGTLNIGGVIMEAFKLAQVSIALFAQQLAGSLAFTTIAINNTTRLVGG